MSLRIITRAEWGAAPPRRSPIPVRWSNVDLHLHHTAGPETQTPRKIQEFHQRVRMWNDVGYHYLIRSDGTIYEGRGPNVEGAHSPDANDEPGVALIGTYTSVAPSEEQRRSVWALLDHLGANRIRGHRDTYATSCPGDAAYRMIVEGGRPTGSHVMEPGAPTQLPTGQLRLGLRVPPYREPEDERRWEDAKAWSALEWIADRGKIDYRTKVWLSFRGQGWTTEPDDRPNFRTVSHPHIVKVARTLVGRHLEEAA